MNMKKVIASVIAGTVAVSAMATSAFAAETVNKTYRAGTDTYEGTATFAVANPASDEIVLTIDDANVTFGFAYEVVDLTIAGTKYEGDAAKLYAKPVDNVITIKPIGIDDGKAISMTVKATAKDATKDSFNDATATVTDGTSPITNFIWNASTKANTTDKVYMAIPTDAVKDLDLINGGTFDGIDATLASLIGSSKGTKLIFKIKDMEAAAADSDNGDFYNQNPGFNATSQDLGIMLNKTATLSTAAEIDKAAMTVTFDWDTLLKNSNITNAVGQVTLIQIIGKNTLASKFVKDGDTYPKYTIESITVATTDAAVVDDTTVVGTDTTTTTADGNTNPPTGATPVVLALIPAALAAVVIAKKRK